MASCPRRRRALTSGCRKDREERPGSDRRFDRLGAVAAIGAAAGVKRLVTGAVPPRRHGRAWPRSAASSSVDASSALWVPIILPHWSGGISILVEGAAEPVPSADIEARDPLRIGNRFG